MANFNVTGFSSDITEGSSLSFDLTPASALVAGVTVRWEIVLDGKLPTSPGFFPTLSGTVTFQVGATAGKTFTIATNDDGDRSEDRSFSVRLIEVAGAQTLFNRKVTLIDDDTSKSFAHTTLPNSGEHDTLVFGSSYTYRSVVGAAGDDTFIITRHQRGDLFIDDLDGEHIIKFDEGVEITHVEEDSQRVFGGRLVISEVSLTLDTGAVITVDAPTTITNSRHIYRYQIGDGEAQIYADFHADLIAGGFVGSTTQLATPVIAGGLNAPSNDGGRDKFTVANLQDTVEEGSDLSFMLTPVSALDAETTVRWEIVLDGKLPASPGFFPTLSGTVTFEVSATAGKTFTIATNDDGDRSEDRSFSVRLIEVAGDGREAQIGGNHAVTLIDDDTSKSFAHTTLPNSGEHDTLVFGSSYTYRSVVGAASDDTFIITRHQRGDLFIDDLDGEHIIKFDEGVEITHVEQDSQRVFGGRLVISEVSLTLDTGAVITIDAPTTITNSRHIYRYQLGDGEAQLYADFHADLIAGGFVASTTELATPYAITGGLPDTGPYYQRWVDANEMVTKLSDGTSVALTGDLGARFHRFAVGDNGVRDEGDAFVDSEPQSREKAELIILDGRVPDNQSEEFNFVGGSDVYLIEQGFDADVTISDPFDVNIIAFGDNVEVKEITLVHSPIGDGEIQDAILRVDTDTSNADPNDTVLVTVAFPQEFYLFYDMNDRVPVLEDFDTFSAEII